MSKKTVTSNDAIRVSMKTPEKDGIEPKYHLDKDDYFIRNRRKCYRLIADKDFYNVKAGDKGGYVTESVTIDHLGTAWVYDGSVVIGDVIIKDNSHVHAKCDIESIQQSCILLEGDVIVSDTKIYTFSKKSITITGYVSIKNKTSIEGNVYISSKNEMLFISNSVIIQVIKAELLYKSESLSSEDEIIISVNGGNIRSSNIIHNATIGCTGFFYLLNSTICGHADILIDKYSVMISSAIIGYYAHIRSEDDFFIFQFDDHFVNRNITYFKNNDEKNQYMISINSRSNNPYIMDLESFKTLKWASTSELNRLFFAEVDMIVAGRFFKYGKRFVEDK